MTLNNCKILKYLSRAQGYNKEISENNLGCKIKVHDIQPKNTSDLVFEFSLPKLDAENKEWRMARLSRREKTRSNDGKDTGKRQCHSGENIKDIYEARKQKIK